MDNELMASLNLEQDLDEARTKAIEEQPASVADIAELMGMSDRAVARQDAITLAWIEAGGDLERLYRLVEERERLSD